MAQPHDHPGLDLKVERTGPCQAKISFRVSPEEFKKSRGQALKSVASRTRMKGFRPGKAPLSILEREYGAAVDRDVVQHFLNHALDDAVRSEGLRPAMRPRVDLDSIQASPEEGFSHELEVWLRPDIELGEVEGLSVEGRPVVVEDDDVGAAIEDLRRQQSRPEPAGEDGLPEDGMAVAKLAYWVEGEDEPALAREGLRLSPSSPPPGVDPEAFRAELTGAKEGDTRTFELTIPDDFPEEAARGKPGRCTLEVLQAFRVRPATDEELHELLQVEDGAGLDAKVRGRLEEARRQNEAHRVENELLERLLAEHPMELPEPLVAEQAEARVAEARQALESRGVAGEELDTQLAQERETARKGAERALRAVYLMEEIAKAKGLEVSAQDLAGEFRSIAERNGVTVDEVRKYYQEEGLLQQLAMELLERKVRNFLRESADIRPGDAGAA